MTILYHHRTLLDGAEGVHITEMIRAFEALGHTVRSFAPGSATGRPGVLPKLVRRVLPQSLFECAAAAHNVVERRRARDLIVRFRPAFVYKRHALNDVSILEAARESGTPSVLEVNALYSSEALQRFEPLRFRTLARKLERRALMLAEVVVAVSSPMRDLVHDIAPSANAIVIPNGADPSRFSPAIDGTLVRRRFDLPAGQLIAGWSGILRSWHRLDLVLEVLKLRPSVVLVIIGDGPDRERIERAAAALGVSDRVRFVGRVPADQIAQHLAAIDVGIVADDRTGYASPMKLVEYMAMGKPVVAPDLPNIRDLVTSGTEGLLFAPGSAESLAACLDRLASPEVRTQLGQSGRAQVVSVRNWMANARLVLDAVNRVHAPRAARTG